MELNGVYPEEITVTSSGTRVEQEHCIMVCYDGRVGR
jgi:hypothetical protein